MNNQNTEHRDAQPIEHSFTNTEVEKVTTSNVSIGEFLKHAREKKNISLKVISQQTKINITNLENLEANHLKDLPNLAYVRGYVKSLSKLLDLNESESLEILDSTYEVKKPVAQAVMPAVEEKKSQGEFPKELIIKIALGLCGIAILVVIVSTQLGNKPSVKVAEPKVEAPVVSQDEVTPQIVTAQTPLEPEMTPVTTEMKTVTEVAKPENKPIVKTEAPKVVEVKKEKKEEEEVKDDDKKKRQFWPLSKELYSIESGVKRSDLLAMMPSEFRGTTIAGKQNIIVLANKTDVWLTYKSDSDPIKKFVLKKGRSVLIRGDEIRIFLGNFAGATLYLNEEPLAISSSSSVKSLVFPQEKRDKYKMPLFVFHDNGKVETSEDYIKREGE